MHRKDILFKLLSSFFIACIHSPDIDNLTKIQLNRLTSSENGETTHKLPHFDQSLINGQVDSPHYNNSVDVDSSDAIKTYRITRSKGISLVYDEELRTMETGTCDTSLSPTLPYENGKLHN